MTQSALLTQTDDGNAVLDNIDTLRNMRLPEDVESTSTFKPLGHGDAFKMIEQSLLKHNLEIDIDHPGAVSYTMINDGAEIFGSLRLQSLVSRGIKSMIGFINSWNKSRALTIGFGSIVIVCQNNHILSSQALRVKHTQANMQSDALSSALEATMAKFHEINIEQGQFFDRMREIELTKKDAKATLFDMFSDGILVGKEAVAVWEQYQNPRFEEFAEKYNLYRLFNAVTDVFKRGITKTVDGIVEQVKPSILSRNGATFVDRSQSMAQLINATYDMGVNQQLTWK